MKPTELKSYVNELVETNLMPNLEDFVRIPNLSRMFDSELFTNGLNEKACKFVMDWAEKQNVKGMKLEFVQNKAPRTPYIFGEVEAQGSDSTVQMYGHIDKQPHLLDAWREGLHPTKPVREGDYAYGRGISDDGYAPFTSIALVKTLQDMKVPHPRFIFFFETDEESGSAYIMDDIADIEHRIGEPNLVICQDSGTIDYNHWSMTSTLRGFVLFKMTAEAVKTSVHSGIGSGIVPDMFRVLTDRIKTIEDPKTGMLIPELQTMIPGKDYMDAEKIVSLKGEDLVKEQNFLDGCKPVSDSLFECYLNNNLRPYLTVTGIDGLPPCKIAGNVLNQKISLMCSLRISPFTDPAHAKKVIQEKLNENVPYNCKFTAEILSAQGGFNTPMYPEHISEMIEETSREVFGKDSVYMHLGGSIPFMGKLREKFPSSYFMVTGQLGPNSNAHAGNENINVEYFKKLIICLTRFMEKSAVAEWEPETKLKKERSKSFHPPSMTKKNEASEL